MPLKPEQRHPLMAITQDGLAHGHLQQTEALLSAGVRWIQLRMKGGDTLERERIALGFVERCHEAGAVAIVNDSVALTLTSHADGVHLGKLDQDWREARALLGADKILGGTVNDEADAKRVRDADCLDYVGLGPWRFTRTKMNLAPVLGEAGMGPLIAGLSPLPVWAIGGIVLDDVSRVRAIGAAGVAVSGALLDSSDAQGWCRAFMKAWEQPV